MNVIQSYERPQAGTIHIGMDVHKETIALAVAHRNMVDDTASVDSIGVIANTPQNLIKSIQRLEKAYSAQAKVVYEAGFCGFTIHRRLTELGVTCEVIAPSLIPKRRGDRVKTDRRDAMELARLHLAGLLTPVWIPDTSQEALRDLVRCRFSLKQKTSQQKLRIRHFFPN